MPSLRQQLVLGVSPWSYRNTIFNQSAHVFSQYCFLKNIIIVSLVVITIYDYKYTDGLVQCQIFMWQ